MSSTPRGGSIEGNSAAIEPAVKRLFDSQQIEDRTTGRIGECRANGSLRA